MQLPNVTILIVDDDTAYIALLKTYLRGCNIVEAGSLEAAARAMDLHYPEVVLLDLGLPDTEGFDATIRQFFAMNPSTAVVILSNHDRRELIANALQSGAQDYLVKSEINAEWLQKSVFKAVVNRYQEIRRGHLMKLISDEISSIWEMLAELHVEQKDIVKKLGSREAQITKRLSEIRELIDPASAKQLQKWQGIVENIEN